VILLVSVAVFLVLQNLVGIATAVALGRPAGMGLLAGSVSMLGGHGTAIAWAPAFAAQFGIENALEIGVLSATAGLVFASLLGGPVARFLVTRHRLDTSSADTPEVGVHYGTASTPIDYFAFLRAVLAIHLSGIIGILLHQGLTNLGINVPLFLPCLMAGILLSNVLPQVAPRLSWPSRTPALALIAEFSLGVFLAMSLMSMQIWTLAHLAGPLVILLSVQAALAVVFAIVVTFRALGQSYDAAVMCAGFIGFSLGATPTAMANMTAITQRHGASHVAFLVVPLVGAFFIDLMNAMVIRAFLSVL
jgi:ESS family glutamate:Na+ symporter